MSKSLGMLKCEVHHGTPIQFTGSTGIYKYHNENIPVLEIKCNLFPIHRFRCAESESNKNWLKVNEIESLKTEKSPEIILEKSWNFFFMFLYEPCDCTTWFVSDQVGNLGLVLF